MMDEDFEVLDLFEDGFPRRHYERQNFYMEMDNKTFFQHFRLTKPTVLSLVQSLEDRLEYTNNLNDPVSPINQILTCLRFYSTGAHLSSIADFMGTHTSTVSRIVKNVSQEIARLSEEYIKMPSNHELLDVQRDFYNIASFPRVAGCIDGTHIKVQSPGGNDSELFRNRNGNFSINSQVVGDANLKIRDIVARWPGSTHDATIYGNSRIRALFENGRFPNSVLLGDSGYMLKTNFLTPIQDPTTRAEQLYNEAHIRTRNTIERLFGVWKRRFPVLAYGIRLKLETTLSVIVATAVLHNIAINMNEPDPPVPEDIHLADLDYLIEMGNVPNIIEDNINVNLNYTRLAFVNNFFANQ